MKMDPRTATNLSRRPTCSAIECTEQEREDSQFCSEECRQALEADRRDQAELADLADLAYPADDGYHFAAPESPPMRVSREAYLQY
jgi:hypothetical protein